MSIGEDEITDIAEYDPKSRAGCKNLTPEIKLGRVIEIVLDGGGPPEIQKKLRIPYKIALDLYKNAFVEAWGMIPDLRSPEVLAGIKDDNLTELQKTIRECGEERDRSSAAGNLNVKAVNAQTAAIKQFSNMAGHNAPTLSANLNVETTLIHPADQEALRRAKPEELDQFLRGNSERRLRHWPPQEGVDDE